MQESDAVIMLPKNSWLSVVLAWLIPFLVLAGGLFVMWALQPTGEVSHGNHNGGTSLFEWTLLIVGVIAVGVLAYFMITTDVLKGLFLKPSSTTEDIDEKRMFWYIVIAVVSAIVAKFFGYTPAGIIALAGVHIVWMKYRKKGSIVTKIVVYGMLIFFVLAWLYPVDAVKARDAGVKITGKVVASTGNKLTYFADNLDLDIEPGRGLVAAAPPLKQPARGGPPVEIALTPQWSVPVSIPAWKHSDAYCSAPGAEFVMYYTSGRSKYTSGVAYPCPSSPSNLDGERMMNLRFGFRSSIPGVTATVTY